LRRARAVITLTRYVRPLTRPGQALAIALAVVAVPFLASGALATPTAPNAPAANSTTYQDSTGEDPAAPDISTIVVSNDDAATVTFKITIANRSQYTPDVAVVMFLDSDANQSTGDPEILGADYIIQLIQGEVLLFKWDGSDYTLSATQASLNSSWAGGPTIKINASDLGNTRKLNFDVTAVSGIVFDQTTGAIDCSACKRDFAPTLGFYTYQLQLTKPTLVVKSLKPTPARPVAGRSFTLRLVAARSDSGAVVQNGRVTCVGRVGTARLKAAAQRVQGGAATCTWSIPANAKGKTFRGSVAVVFEGLRASQGYTGKVR
jgi:hypothetical protein